MATHQMEVPFGFLPRFQTIRIAVPTFGFPAQWRRPVAMRPAVSRDEAEELLHELLWAPPAETAPYTYKSDDLVICSRIRRALYS